MSDLVTRLMEELFSEQQACPRKWWKQLQMGRPTGLGPRSFAEHAANAKAAEEWLKRNTDTYFTNMTKNPLTPLEADRIRDLLIRLKERGAHAAQNVLELHRDDWTWAPLVDRVERIGLVKRRITGWALVFEITAKGKMWLAASQKPEEPVWTTREGKKLKPSEMSSEHLFNATVFVLNNPVLAGSHWPKTFAKELKRRGVSVPDGSAAAHARVVELEKRLAKAERALQGKD